MRTDQMFADGLRDLTEALAARGVEISGGFLGGEFGYGADFENPVFEMHPFWWGDCECGFESIEQQWTTEHPHAGNCYQSELERRGGYEAARSLAAEWGLPEFGCAVHCTCTVEADRQAWSAENRHVATCGMVRPNFKHKASGLEIHWYKYIGRSMEANREVSVREWLRILVECTDSLGPAPVRPDAPPRRA